MPSFIDKLLGRKPSSTPPAASTAPRPAAVVPPGMRQEPGTVGLADFFTRDHRHCDDVWARVEAAAQQGDGAAIQGAFAEFQHSMLRHLGWEEDVLFPAFEGATGMAGGPTMVMRSEHDQMRKVLVAMADAVDQGEVDSLLDLGDTLLMLIQQHNVKEEGMLYPMAENALLARWPELRQQLQD